MKSKTKKDFYESATAKILAQIDEFGLSKSDRQRAIYFTKLFREAFKYDEIKKYIFLTPNNKIWDFGYDSAGFCRVASISFAIAMGIKDWRLMYIDNTMWSGIPHHYLQHVPTGKFFDMTYDQFDMPVPYELGHQDTFGLSPGDKAIKFADALGIDVFELLKKQSDGK